LDFRPEALFFLNQVQKKDKIYIYIG
jgi:hypothetical protein